jgi:hypothetical protein
MPRPGKAFRAWPQSTAADRAAHRAALTRAYEETLAELGPITPDNAPAWTARQSELASAYTADLVCDTRGETT